MRDWTGLKAGDQVVFEGFSDPMHSHWSFEVGNTYRVVNSWGSSGVAIKSGNGQLANFNWGFDFKKLVGGEAFPTFDFKLRNGTNPLVRHWLKENGFQWYSNSDLTTAKLSRAFLVCDVGDLRVSWYDEDDFAELPEEEVMVEFTTTVKTTWGVRDTSETEAKIAKLRQEIEELESSLL